MNPSTPENKRSYFGYVAETYDRLQPIVAGPAYDRGLGMVVGLVPFDHDDAFEFVELGCGTAELSARVLEHFPRAGGTCIDNEPEMLQIARRKLESYGDRGNVQQADMTMSDIRRCDVVLSSKAFHHLSPDDLTSVIGRIARVLRPGGCFILLDHMSAGPKWAEKVRQQSRRVYDRHVQAAIAAGRATQEETDARLAFKKKMKAEGKDTEYRHTADTILADMSKAGFHEADLLVE